MTYYQTQLGRHLRHIIPPQQRILDLGCGSGNTLELLQPSYGVGLDIDPGKISAAKERHPHLHFFVSDIEDPQIGTEPFDYILLNNTIGFLDDVQKAMRQARRFAEPRTRIVITHYSYLWAPLLKLAERIGLKQKEPYLNWLSFHEIETILRLEGFETVRKEQSMLLPVPVPAISTFMNRYLSHLPVLWRLSLVESVVARPATARGPVESAACSIIVPARNERGNIEELVRRVPALGRETEIIFVEGHSTDGTRAEIDRVIEAYPGRSIRVFEQEGEGKGDAVRKGFSHARGDVLMILDADLAVRPEDLRKFYDAVVSGHAELVIGNRLVYPIQRHSMRFLNLLGNKIFSMMFSYLLEQRIKDTLCGTKALRRDRYERIAANRDYFGTLDPFGDFDLIFGAAKANLKIVDIPVRYYARRYGTTQIRRFLHGFLLLRMVCIAMRKLKFVD